jgi:GNAT superfamily N-acetyltransferase
VSVHGRRATPADAGQIAECLAELGYGTRAELVAEKLDALAGRADGAAFVAVDPPGNPSGDPRAARVLGAASVHVLPLFHAPGSLARLTALAVRREAQGRGVGRALVAAVEAFAWGADCRRVEVTSGDHRSGAHAFYRTLGYAEDERRFIKRAP